MRSASAWRAENGRPLTEPPFGEGETPVEPYAANAASPTARNSSAGSGSLSAMAAMLVLLLGGAAGATPVPEGPLTLETLMEQMSRTHGVVAEFREVKHLALLEAPVESHGRLSFVPPDRMVRRITRPGESTLVIDGERMRFRNEAGGDEFDLSQNPAVRQFVESFVVLFRGDLDALRRAYDVSFTSEDRDWALTLTPRNAPVTSFIERVEMHGDGPRMARMEIVEPDGDRTTTIFEEVDVDHRFTPEELESLFRPLAPGATP